jgi:hypothetical protein
MLGREKIELKIKRKLQIEDELNGKIKILDYV